jgi:hypothetical protein
MEDVPFRRDLMDGEGFPKQKNNIIQTWKYQSRQCIQNCMDRGRCHAKESGQFADWQ